MGQPLKNEAQTLSGLVGHDVVAASTSVEELSGSCPYSPRKLGVQLVRDHIDSFGNLALLSYGENSSYSKQRVGEKREDFKGKLRSDSLKLSTSFVAMPRWIGTCSLSPDITHRC